MSKHLVFTVTNALNFDQRMQRICNSLLQAGYRVTLVGWEYVDSPKLITQKFEQLRIPIKNKSGKMRYLEYNYKLIGALKKLQPNLVGAIDLDTIIPNYYIAKQLNIPIIYDAHEYFTELEEIVRRPITHFIWKQIEAFFVPRIKNGYAVNNSYVQLFQEKYQVHYEIIRNATVLKPFSIPVKTTRYILYQGAVSEGRALKQLIDAMQLVDCTLLICGQGELYEPLVAYVKTISWANKIIFKGFVLPAELISITQHATIGITLFEVNGLSNYYSLANRFFDYMHAGVPQLCNNYPEYHRINKEFELAVLLNEISAETIANALTNLLSQETQLTYLGEQAIQASQVYNWQAEEKKLIQFYKHLIKP
jgi:glycosyltransferase involved in cell wall biosynthesis